MANDIASVLDALDIGSAAIVGFSQGGLVAQELAIRHPDRVRSLLLTSTYAYMNQQSRLFLDAVADVYANGASATQMFHLIAPWLFSESFVRDPDNAAFFVLPVGAADDQTRDDWLRLYGAQHLFDTRARLAQITAPTIVFSGAADSLVSVDDARTLALGIPNAELRILEGVGHLVNVEDPTAFRAALRAVAGICRK